MDDILAGDQGIFLLKWRQKWQLVGPEPHTKHSPLAVAQHTRTPDIWHSWAATPQTGGNPAPRPAGYKSPVALSRKWANSKIIIKIIKKYVNDTAPCPVASGHPREQGMSQSEGRWRHKDFPANAGSRLYCTLHHIYFYIYIFIKIQTEGLGWKG